MDEINGFEALCVQTSATADDINAIVKNNISKKEANFKIQSTSKYFNHNRNVDSSMTLLFHFLGYLNLNELFQKFHGRAGVGRCNKELNWSINIKN